MLTTTVTNRKWWQAPLLFSALAIAGCGGDSDGGSIMSFSSDESVIINGIANDFGSAAVEIYNFSSPYTGATDLNPGVSDTFVERFEDLYFVVRAFENDTITAYNISDTASALYQASTNDETTVGSSNPHDLVFVSREKAYLLRYGSPVMWIVNPSAADASGFKLGEIDLSAYDSDGVPDMTRGVVVGDRLYVLMQRLENFAAVKPGAVAVIDTTTDTEIDTGTSGEFQGVALPVYNPKELSFDEASRRILIAASGDSGFGTDGPVFNGGVAALDTADNSVSVVFSNTEETGRSNNVLALDEETAFIVNSASFREDTLVRINPLSGEVVVDGFGGLSATIIQALAIGPSGNLWVGIGDSANPRVVILDPETGEQAAETLSTRLDPKQILFP
jgi:hypothetical protein